jgi:hypothetical protein
VLVAALELYRARHGHYPQRLAELVPEELEALPKDPFGGREFRYALTGPPAYRLYSVGPNLMDEGGMAPAGTEGEDGDLVFSEPE